MTIKEKAEQLYKKAGTFIITCVGTDGYPHVKAVVPGKYRDSLKEILAKFVQRRLSGKILHRSGFLRFKIFYNFWQVLCKFQTRRFCGLNIFLINIYHSVHQLR